MPIGTPEKITDFIGGFIYCFGSIYRSGRKSDRFCHLSDHRWNRYRNHVEYFADLYSRSSSRPHPRTLCFTQSADHRPRYLIRPNHQLAACRRDRTGYRYSGYLERPNGLAMDVLGRKCAGSLIFCLYVLCTRKPQMDGFQSPERRSPQTVEAHRGRTICTGRTAGYPGECFSGQRKGAFPVPIQGENETGDLDRDHSGSFPAMVRNQCDLQLCTGNLYLGRVYDFGHVLQYHRHR